MKKYFSFDAETNGLWGQAFSIGCIITNENGQELNKFVARCPIEGQVNEFVEENVLPEMEDIKITHENYNSMLKDFMKFYMDNKENSTILVHMGLPVESRLFLDAHELGFIGDWDAPYPLVDISAIPEIGTSPDTYNKNNGVVIPALDGGTHNPLYDSWSALLAYVHFRNNDKNDINVVIKKEMYFKLETDGSIQIGSPMNGKFERLTCDGKTLQLTSGEGHYMGGVRASTREITEDEAINWYSCKRKKINS